MANNKIQFLFAGDVVCSKCQHIFSFSAIENFYAPIKSAKTPSDQDRARELFLNSKPKILFDASQIDKNAIPVDEMEPNAVENVFEYLQIENISVSAVSGIQMLCNVERKILYMPMHNNESQIIGYKTLSRLPDGPLKETTLPEAKSFGVVILPPTTKRGRDSKTAILVLNMLDALALRIEKPNGIN